MITALACVAILGSSVQDKIDFQLGWKLGDKFTYIVGMKTRSYDGDGLMTITVTKADEKAFTVTWAEVAFSGDTSPLPAGSSSISKRGRLIGKSTGAVNLFLAQMHLPEEAVKVGEEFKVAYAFSDARIDLRGKLEKIDERKGKVAHFTFEGALTIPFVGASELKQQSVFNITRGLLVSSEWDMEGVGNISLKLVEDDS
ncbi:MAG: hypothetical protein IH944_08225 [Armatimonadetes bacterium]|nr:hypothetical protein [Armatimonadota bacterium]